MNNILSKARTKFSPKYRILKRQFELFLIKNFGQHYQYDQKRLQTKLEQISSFDELYDFSQEEFGLIQIKSEIKDFLDFSSRRNPKIACEIGLKNGGNSFLFLHYLETLEYLIAIDVKLNNIGKLNVLKRRNQKVLYIESNSQSLATMNLVQRRLKGKLFDLLFIDGDHSYNGVKNDFRNYLHLVKDGGMIVFHDIVDDRSEITSVEEFDSQECLLYSGGVPRFWNEVKPYYQHQEFICDVNQRGFGIGVLIKDSSVVVCDDFNT